MAARAENGFPAMRDCTECEGSETNEDAVYKEKS